MNIPSFHSVIGLAFLFSVATLSTNAQSESTIFVGKSLDSIKIGESTETDVIAAYGPEYKLIKHKDYSYEMIYRDRGLGFYYCASDPRKQIFVVEIEQPARVATPQGIRLGVSTMRQVFDAYGKPVVTSAGYEYEGIYFDIAEDDEEENSPDARDETPAPATTPAAAAADSQSTNAANTNSNAINSVNSSVNNSSNAVLNSVNSTTTNNSVPNSNSGSNQLNSVNSTLGNNSTNNSNSIGNNSNSNRRNSARSREAERERYVAQQMKEVSDKVVRRIELVESTGLRQCHLNSQR